MAAAYEDPALAPLAEQARHFSPSALGGKPILVKEVTEYWREQAASSQEHLQWMRDMGFHTLMSVPLVARGRTLGVMTFLGIRPERRFTPEHLTLAEELGRRAALAVDHARLYAEAQLAVRGREELLLLVLHELKSPMTSVALRNQMLVMEAQRLEDSPNAHRLRSRAEATRRQSTQALDILSQYLEVSRVLSGHWRLKPEEVRQLGPAAAEAGRLLPPVRHHLSRHEQAYPHPCGSR